MLRQEIIVLGLQLCILLFGGLVLATVECLKVNTYWAYGTLLLLIVASSRHRGVLIRAAGGAVVVHSDVRVIEGLVILVADKILIFRSCHR
jgi:hypothetical protein